MQPLIDTFRHVPVAMIFIIAEDGVTDNRHMGAELVLPARDRLQ
jgi:hypothetical protein